MQDSYEMNSKYAGLPDQATKSNWDALAKRKFLEKQVSVWRNTVWAKKKKKKKSDANNCIFE